MAFRIFGLNAGPFTHLFGQGEHYLKNHGALRINVDTFPGYPDRISLRDIPAGETAILINHTCQPADTPTRALMQFTCGKDVLSKGYTLIKYRNRSVPDFFH